MNQFLQDTNPMVPFLDPQTGAGKRITIKYTAGAKAPVQLLVGAGTMVQDALNELGLGAGYFLTKSGLDHTLAPQENLYQNVDDGELLYVSADMTFGKET